MFGGSIQDGGNAGSWWNRIQSLHPRHVLISFSFFPLVDLLRHAAGSSLSRNDCKLIFPPRRKTINSGNVFGRCCGWFTPIRLCCWALAENFMESSRNCHRPPRLLNGHKFPRRTGILIIIVVAPTLKLHLLVGRRKKTLPLKIP